jgi:hypothetical protein
MHVKGPEARCCPPEFQARLTRMFGSNPFGEPNFKIVWTQSHFIRMGNLWRDKYGNERRGYRDRYTCPTPCWAILRWRSPKEYGSPTLYRMQTWDSVSKLYALGEYPWKGRYEVLYGLYRKEFIGGKLLIDRMQLSHILIDKMIPMILQAQSLSRWERKAANDLAKEREHKREVAEITDRMVNELPPWYGPVSFARQGCRTSVLDKKMELIQKQWDRLTRRGRRPKFQRGFAQGRSPRIINR